MNRWCDNYCDDGNNKSGDGCTNCRVDKGWTCSGGDANNPDTCTEICGDGLKLGGNQCDDGNTQSGDGCDSSCNLEPGWRCQYTSASGCDKCFPVCEDGLVVGWEECDDGGIPVKGNGDGCSSSCKIEPGFSCSGEPS
jgi:cysteine-rich repeat protein